MFYLPPPPHPRTTLQKMRRGSGFNTFNTSLSPVPGVVYVVAAMATSWCIRRVAVAEQPEAAGRVLVVQS